jgi:hypothetical protein
MLIGLTGKKRHGKDTAGRYLVEHYGFTQVGFADKVREMALAIDPLVASELRLSELVGAFDWEHAKSVPEVRRLLQRIGTEGVRDTLGEDAWVRAAFKDLDRNRDYVFTDVRFLNEAAAVKQAGGVVWRVSRPDLPDDGDTHASELELEQIQPDALVINGLGFPDTLHSEIAWAAQALDKTMHRC